MKEEIRKTIKVYDNLIPIKENILEEQEQLHDVKVEYFAKIQKMVDIIKVLEIHLENASQINQKMESLQVKIEELDRWRNIEKNSLSGLSGIKACDIRLHTLDTNECHDLASKV